MNNAALKVAAILNLLLGVAGALPAIYLIGSGLMFLGSEGASSFGSFIALIFVLGGLGILLLALSPLRWGIAVLRGRPTIALIPGYHLRIGRFGQVTGVFLAGLVFFLLSQSGLGFTFTLSDGIGENLPRAVAYVIIAVQVLTAIVATRLDRAQRAATEE